MEKTIFYAPDILSHPQLPKEEALHCLKVLRKREGDEILVTDGKAHFFDAVILQADPKKCMVEVINTIEQKNPWDFYLQIAFAPTKNIDRIEWFAEKATEIGIDKFTPVLCRYSERREIKKERIERVLISAIKQSQKAQLPQIEDMIPFSDFVKQPFDGKKYIAHCDEGEKLLIRDIYKKGENALILIGPEGDFSKEEIEKALQNGFQAVSLGESRLRTETAALVACHTIHVLNQ